MGFGPGPVGYPTTMTASDPQPIAPIDPPPPPPPPPTVESLIRQARAVLHGEYSSTDRVIDALLDLRLAAPDPLLVAVVDERLGALPGHLVVPNTWWTDALRTIEQASTQLSDSVSV